MLPFGQRPIPGETRGPRRAGEQLLGLMTAAAVQASAKHSDDLDYVLGSKLGGSPADKVPLKLSRGQTYRGAVQPLRAPPCPDPRATRLGSSRSLNLRIGYSIDENGGDRDVRFRKRARPSVQRSVEGSCKATGLKRLFAFRLVDAVPIRRGRIMAEGLDAFGVHMIKRADAESFSSLEAGFDCVQCLRPTLLAVIPQHLGRELVQF